MTNDPRVPAVLAGIARKTSDVDLAELIAAGAVATATDDATAEQIVEAVLARLPARLRQPSTLDQLRDRERARRDEGNVGGLADYRKRLDAERAAQRETRERRKTAKERMGLA